MNKNELERLKLIEIELAYLRKIIETFINEKNVEIHTHYHADYSNMKPMIINDLKGLKEFTDEL